ncbi:MAG TPA: hypothetical protein VFY29_01580 [Terriglobia bacterium]|nr:hypothetical protein [Terriglobia bacterium]
MTPGVGDLAALQDDVIDRTLRQEPACRKPGVAGADDNRGYSFDDRLQCFRINARC